ncbi:MAG: general secretion pathway protein GspK [Kiritimatiellae bacterium]|nr:general secretion pathway protein GspK [Kiritimatiellia bacterium]
MPSPDNRNGPAARAARGREGASLVLVLCAAGVLLTLSLGAAALAAGRARRAEDALLRAALRDGAREAVFRAAEALCADTNGVDHLGEAWALASTEAEEALAHGGDGTFVRIGDECARLAFPASGEAALAALLAEAGGADAAVARGMAHSIFLRRRELEETAAADPGAATNGVFAAEEELLAVPVEDPAALARALPFLSVRPDAAIGANTAPRETVVALALAAGASREGAEGVWARLQMARGRGDVFETTDMAEALKLLRGEGDVPTAAEIEALQLLKPRLRVGSDLFRIEATARRGHVAVRAECVWDRDARRILRWVE